MLWADSWEKDAPADSTARAIINDLLVGMDLRSGDLYN
jgi:hypothetical protein